jgi:hypothetical protein
MLAPARRHTHGHAPSAHHHAAPCRLLVAHDHVQGDHGQSSGSTLLPHPSSAPVQGRVCRVDQT